MERQTRVIKVLDWNSFRTTDNKLIKIWQLNIKKGKETKGTEILKDLIEDKEVSIDPLFEQEDVIIGNVFILNALEKGQSQQLDVLDAIKLHNKHRNIFEVKK